MTELTVTFVLNGREQRINTLPNRTLLDVLRVDFGLTGAKDACGGEGECGACTILLDETPVNSCMVFIGQAEGKYITTIEGLTPEEGYHPLQKAFVEVGAVQCGYCTPGAVLVIKALLDNNPMPNDDQIRESLAGNLCRCTGYTKMIDAIQLMMEGDTNA
jgi:carbon-monoxide dehydrogenase small subunit